MNMNEIQMVLTALDCAVVVMSIGLVGVLICCLAVAVVAIREGALRRKRRQK